jgi:glycosyltransferase involved in cell wall biosynthesis
MRIVYVAHVNELATSGVASKVAGQLHEWRRQGHDAWLLLLTRDRGASELRLANAHVFTYAGMVGRMRALLRLVRAARRLAPTVVYFRGDIFYPQLLGLPRTATLILEINSDDMAEFRLGSRRRFEYNRLTRGLLLRQARGVIFVTSELQRSPSFAAYQGASVVITNGIQLSEYPIVPAPANPRPRLVFVGTSGQIWQGMDKVVQLAGLEPGWDFDIIGARMEQDKAGGAGATPANVRWHGPLDHSSALGVMAGADIGIGTLALHRKAMNEACALKLREYLAMGLPVIYGNEDADVDAVPELALRIPNTETNVTTDIRRIEMFVEASRGRRVPRSAVGHLDSQVKEGQRLDFLRQVTKQP